MWTVSFMYLGEVLYEMQLGKADFPPSIITLSKSDTIVIRDKDGDVIFRFIKD